MITFGLWRDVITIPAIREEVFSVAEHFNLADYNNAQDMKVSVVKQVNSGTAPRQREERRVIFKLKTLAPSGMNIEFKFI